MRLSLWLFFADCRVILTAFFMSLIFFIWSVAILGSKFCCRRKAGFFSGQPPIKPLPPPGYQALDPQRRTPDDLSICQNQQDEITEDNDEMVPIEERTVSEPKDDQENLIVVNPETSAQSSVNLEDRQSRHCPTQQEIEAYENGIKSGHLFLRRLRIIIFVAGLAVITSSIVFVVQGIYGQLGPAVAGEKGASGKGHEVVCSLGVTGRIKGDGAQ